MKDDQSNHRKCIGRVFVLSLVCVAFIGPAVGCRDLQKRRIELKQSSGANPDIDSRFGLTSDAQDPTERDKEMGYGRWKEKPETAGTSDPTSPARRGSIGDP